MTMMLVCVGCGFNIGVVYVIFAMCFRGKVLEDIKV